MAADRHRLLVPRDLDGAVSAALLSAVGRVGEIVVVPEPGGGGTSVRREPGDITVNLAFHPSVHLAFDHQALPSSNVPPNRITRYGAPSTARVIVEHFGEGAFPEWSEAVAAADHGPAQLWEPTEVLNPVGWDLLSLVIDGRAGMGFSPRFATAPEAAFLALVRQIGRSPVDALLAVEGVAERVAAYQSQREAAIDQIHRRTSRHGPVVAVDLRGARAHWAPQRLIVDALHPDHPLSLRLVWADDDGSTLVVAARSVYHPDDPVDLGRILRQFGGEGEPDLASCVFPPELGERGPRELTQRLVDAALDRGSWAA